ncbi:cilium assembly protein DZIP1 isoform X1 [Solea solea]|uniref:cilium assembly protein DZIP1 isoform X1 n=2 Tax=Solea solea TaxID=90069 RepID=UPI00272A1488|nr:cilium assembly protein DZIP1 isoform X1 [Solea solea]XP_058479048.1 cilium assembly protein DZIP1 isoform X1 [Solea solea]
MPFHEGVYTPYTGDTQGTHSSAGIPSLLNSPLSQHTVNGHSVPSAEMTPSIGTASIPPFKFRPRRETVDWRRINAVDVDHVVSQLDVDTLQEHINTVTFCSLDGERCQRCQSPVDPVLIKLLRLAQFTVEWVLHCQEVLTLNLHAAEEKLAAGGRERKELLDQQTKQEEKVKSMAAELKQRKKMIRTQQSLLVPHISSKKCAHCDKTFLNATFLQSHLQRRHPEEYESQLRSDNENKSVIEDLKVEISSQKEQISQLQQSLQAKTAQSHVQRRHPEDYGGELHSDSEKKSVIDNLKMEIVNQKEQMVQLQQSLQAKSAVEKELQNMHKDLMRELDHFKTEEMTRNIQALNEANQNLTAKHSQPERDLDIYKEMQTHAIQKLEHQLVKQEKKMESRLQDIQAQHESEKNQLLKELGKMQSSVSRLQQERSQWQQQEMERRLQEKEQTIQSQRKQMRNVSSKPPKVIEVPVSAPAPEAKPKKVVLEEPVFAFNLDPIQELTEEERDSSSVSERRPVEKKLEPVRERKQNVSSSSLKKDPRMKKEIRQVLEQTLIKRLETLGLKSDQGGLKKKTFTSCSTKMQSEQDKTAKKMPDYWHHREELANTLEEKMGGQRRGSSPASKSQAAFRLSDKALQIRPRSSSLPSRSSHVTSGPAVTQPKTPQPAPRTKSTAQPKTSTPNTKTVQRTFKDKTPPFSSEEESEEEDQPQRHRSGKTPQSRLNQANPIQVKAGKASPVQTSKSLSSGSQQPRGSAGVVTKTAITKIDSGDDDTEWSEVSELHEIDPRQLQSYTDQNGNMDKRNFGKENKINIMARKIGQHYAQRSVKKPAGAVSILTERKDMVQELEDTDLEESSDWLVSSLEDRLESSKPAQGSGPLKKSVDSPSTSVWGTSTGKAPKSAGLTDAGTGSTLKSTLCSLSDISDSDDISN